MLSNTHSSFSFLCTGVNQKLIFICDSRKKKHFVLTFISICWIVNITKNVLVLQILFSNKHIELYSDAWSSFGVNGKTLTFCISGRADLFLCGKELHFSQNFCVYCLLFWFWTSSFQKTFRAYSQINPLLEKMLHSKSYSSGFPTSEILS